MTVPRSAIRMQRSRSVELLNDSSKQPAMSIALIRIKMFEPCIPPFPTRKSSAQRVEGAGYITGFMCSDSKR